IRGKKVRIQSDPAYFEMGMLDVQDWTAKWIHDAKDKDFGPAPLFRKTFEASNKKIKYARAYISGLGYYELFLNGKRIGDHLMDPGFTTYDKRVLYVTHDVSSFIQSGGENTIGVVLGNGFFNEQRMGRWSWSDAPWRDRSKMICEIHVSYADGTKQIIATDPTWKTSTGPSLFNNVYVGEYFDNRLNQSDWKYADFDDSTWGYVSLAPVLPVKMEAQQIPPIRITRKIKPQKMTKLSP